ncbi:hypothetical protein IFR04_005642 [Cadophora malorum]|uniref:Uncharacterized protein n=1 Tax=Cadophora malorum TaxID=108018 RepID=A0A8H7TKU0_9HELO|nr:hypothetical protein IFR04_005642 [Cadophora malorum]
MSERNGAATFLERVVARFLSLVVAVGVIMPRTPAQIRSSNTKSEVEKDVLLDLRNKREGLRDRVALAQAREIVKDLYKQGEELRKKMKDMLVDIKVKGLQAAKADCERVMRGGDYPAETVDNLRMKRQMVLNLSAMGYECKITDTWEVLFKHQITVAKRLIARAVAEPRG